MTTTNNMESTTETLLSSKKEIMAETTGMKMEETVVVAEDMPVDLFRLLLIMRMPSLEGPDKEDLGHPRATRASTMAQAVSREAVVEADQEEAAIIIGTLDFQMAHTVEVDTHHLCTATTKTIKHKKKRAKVRSRTLNPLTTVISIKNAETECRKLSTQKCGKSSHSGFS
jgi:hypothetical protein